jgi:hypothetical protein
MMTYYLFRTYRIFWGAQSGGGEIPVECSRFFDRLSEPRKIETYMD